MATPLAKCLREYSLSQGQPQDLIKQVIHRLKEKGETLSLAESCTGGLLASWITAQSGVSSVFRGAVVSYAGEVKRDLLNVPEDILKLHGEVSELVAQKMATGVQKKLKSHWSASITGIAGPTGGSKDKPVGTVCFCVVGPNIEESCTHYFDSSLTRLEIQKQSASFALNLLLNHLNQ